MGAPVHVKQPLVKGMDKWMKTPANDAPFADKIKQIKDILKDHDTQNHLLPLKFHRHIKPPVHPPARHLVEKEVVAGKKVPFSKVMAKRVQKEIQTKAQDEAMALRTIYETKEYDPTRTVQQYVPSVFLLK
ncbi:hypothetical protein DYB32_008138 [Aphanomyces invadans]|uniref:Uncharacterized protein n=1 Tax=Aphanomyces invadans TaxID=157072 RepID=A0A3R6ZKM7_9STRA|nr:hypothetical protein DYB32_008138 [Aphanomyces invadans]